MNGKLRIVTDSAVWLDPEFVEQHGIVVVPMTVELEGQRYREGIDIDHQTFLQKLETATTLPHLIAPSAREWAAAYQSLVKEAEYILVLPHSARLSEAFINAREAVNYVFGRARFWVVDTETIGYGQGMIVRRAVEFAEQGMPAPEVVRLVRAMIPHVYAQFLMDRLDYLEKYGRVGPAQALLGTMLNIKPLVTVENGDLIPVEKVLKWEDGVEKLHDFVVEFLHIEELAIVQNNMEDETALLLERLEMTLGKQDFPVYPYGASLAVHLGPKVLGVFVYEGLEPGW